MKTKIISLIICVGTITACSYEQKYRYVEVVNETSISGGKSIVEKPEKEIIAQSDTDAYIKAYQQFCVAQKTYQELLKKNMKYLSEPLKFKIYNANGEEISDIKFKTKEAQEKKISEIVFSINAKSIAKKDDENQLGDWEISNYVDDFGDKTKEKYVRQSAFGSFSNSATTNSDLVVGILIDKKNIRFQLKEYGRHPVNSGSINFKMKRNDSIIGKFTMSAYDYGYIQFPDWDSNKNNEIKKLKKTLLQGGEIKFHGEINSYSRSTYNFILNCDYLKNALKELDKKEDEGKK